MSRILSMRLAPGAGLLPLCVPGSTWIVHWGVQLLRQKARFPWAPRWCARNLWAGTGTLPAHPCELLPAGTPASGRLGDWDQDWPRPCVPPSGGTRLGGGPAVWPVAVNSGRQTLLRAPSTGHHNCH